ncbi:MAG: hypothetical protein RBU45_23130 [Myxococcota bacterium]|jgi:hypothetical protein|nr:hypothetical protein [Myxococcota bacterium]
MVLTPYDLRMLSYLITDRTLELRASLADNVRKPGDRDEICNEYLAESWDPSNAGFVKRALWFVVQVQRVEQLRFN